MKNTTDIRFDLEALKKEYFEFVKSLKGQKDFEDGKPTYENFLIFLEYYGLTTTHAQTVYAAIEKNKMPILGINHFKLRKQHSKRDFAIKKVLIPTIATGAVVGGVGAGIAASNMVAGSLMYGFIPVTKNVLVNMAMAGIPGAAIGAAATVGAIAAKNIGTRLYYKMRYGSASQNLNKIENGVKLENLPISKLMNKIENTNNKILNLRDGKKSTSIFRKAYRHFLNAVNRNRIHHLEAYTKDLVKIFDKIGSQGTKEEFLQMQPTYTLLKQVDNFIQKDVQTGKLYNLLTCKEKDNHVHVDYMENLDIYTKLAMYLDCVDLLNPVNAGEKTIQKQQVKNYKATKKNLDQQNSTAERILNGENLLKRCSKRYEAAYKAAHPTKEILNYVVSTDGSIHITFDDGSQKFLEGIYDPSKTIASLEAIKNKVILTYTDGTTSQKSLTEKKPSKDIATEGNILRNLNDETFTRELIARGFTAEAIGKLRTELESRLKPTRKPRKLYGTPTFKNENMASLYNACLDIINTQKGFAI